MACWENAVIIYSSLRKEITTPCLAMHQGSGICEKQQENIICVWESPSWANSCVLCKTSTLVVAETPQWLCWHWFAAVPSGTTLSQACVTIQHNAHTAAQLSTRSGKQMTIHTFAFPFQHFPTEEKWTDVKMTDTNIENRQKQQKTTKRVKTDSSKDTWTNWVVFVVFLYEMEVLCAVVWPLNVVEYVQANFSQRLDPLCFCEKARQKR